MKRVLVSIIVLFAFFAVHDLTAQTVNVTVNDDIYEKVHIPSRKPIPLPYVREADVMWSRKIWRILDLREKMNHPLYYPTSPIGSRKSLAQVLIESVEKEGVKAYRTDDFQRPDYMSWEDIKIKFDAVDGQEIGKTLDGRDSVYKIIGEIKPYEIKEFMIKEEWYFDKKLGRLNVRIIGICPIRVYTKSTGGGIPQVTKTQTFWIYFPEVRQQLVNAEVFNPANDAKRMSFDDMFLKRIFSSYIVKESNTYDDRQIDDYVVGGINAQLESNRIKQRIFEFEHDLWEY